METFADYMLSEKEWITKMQIMHYLKKETGIFFDNSVLFKTFFAKLFLDNVRLDLDENIVLTACLLCNCKKSDDPQDLFKIKSYAKDGAEYLGELGFSKRFCKICEEVNRYSKSLPREKESDILELVDQLGGMLLDRPERIAFKVDEALVLLEYRNLRDLKNKYLSKFKKFINEMQEILVLNGSKSIIQACADEINGLEDRNNDKLGIKTVINLYEIVQKAKLVDEIREDKEEFQEHITPIVTGDQIKANMNNVDI